MELKPIDFYKAEQIRKHCMGGRLIEYIKRIGLLNPVFEIPPVWHPKDGTSIQIRVVNVRNMLRRHFTGSFQYQIPLEDRQYSLMYMDMNTFYGNLSSKLQEQYLETKAEFAEYEKNQNKNPKTGDVVVAHVSKNNFQRARLTSDVHKDVWNSCAKLRLLDEDAGATVTLPLRKILPLHEKFSKLQPRSRYFSLHELSLYKDVNCFSGIIRNAYEDLFSGQITAKFVNSDKSGDALVMIQGPKYPIDKFPLGLGGLWIKNIISGMNEPCLADEGYYRDRASICQGSTKGDFYVGIYTPIYEHLMQIIYDLNDTKFQLLKNSENTIRVKFPLSHEKIYLAPYATDGCYYRAKYLSSVTDKTEDSTKEAEMLFIDYGTTQTVKISDLILAKKINFVLSVLPSQILKVHLTGVDFIDTEKLSLISGFGGDNSEIFLVKTLKSATIDKLAEVEIRRTTKKNPIFNNLNEELVVTIGDGDIKSCKLKISELTKYYHIQPEMLERSLIRSIIDTRFIIWSGVNDSLEIFQPHHKFEVKVMVDTSGSLDAGSIVIVPPKRLSYLSALEKEILTYRQKLQETSDSYKNVSRSYLHLKMNNFLGCWMEDEKKVVRVKLLETWQSLQIKQRKFGTSCNVYLIDYGMKKEVLIKDLLKLDEDHCRYPPFAVPAKIDMWPGSKLNVREIEPMLLQMIFGDRIYEVSVLSLSYDSFDVPNAVVQFKFQKDLYFARTKPSA